MFSLLVSYLNLYDWSREEKIQNFFCDDLKMERQTGILKKKEDIHGRETQKREDYRIDEE